MLKLIKSEPYFAGDEPAVRIIDTVDRSGLVKAAADSKIMEYVSKIQPEPNKVFLHILALGAGEYYGPNRNADWFGENALIDYHKTFETAPAHVFRNHQNRDPAIAIGQVVFAIYNDRMHRCELIAWIDKDKGRDIIERLERGDYPSTSMACRTKYDVCSICQNRAHTRQEYCEHMTEELGRMYPDGRKVMALNVAPLNFFDISIVVRPADVTSSVLQKVAFANDQVVGSAELAEIEGLTEKEASLKKLSEFIKEISDGVVVDADPSLDVILDKVKDPTHDAIDILRNYDLKQTLCSLAHLGISPSLGWLAELIARKTLGKGGEGIGGLVEGYIKEVGVDGLPIAQGDFGDPVGPNIAIVSALTPSIKQASLMPEYVEGRILEGGNAYIPGTNVGYIGNGPRIEETPYEKFRRENLAQHPEGNVVLAPLVKTLMIRGGAALAAKWYITQLIEQKMRENEASMLRTDAKIRLVEKRAEDYRSTHRLAKSDMIRVLKQRIN
jgi:hypothetical protein